MKKFRFLPALLVAVVLSLSGCMTNAAPRQTAAEATQAAPTNAPAPSSTGTVSTPQPIIGAEGVPRPDWVRNPGKMETADMMYFVGEGRAGSTTTARKNSAVADAGRQVADWKESVIKSAVKDYVQEAGESGSTQSLEMLEVASIQRAKANTSGIRQTETWIAPDNSYVVLVSYPKADIKQDFRTSVNNFVRNEGAAYAEFKANEAFRFLEQELEPGR